MLKKLFNFKRKIKEIKYPKTSFAKKFINKAKDPTIEHFFIKVDKELLLIKSGSRSKCEFTKGELRNILKNKIKNLDSLKKATMIHNHPTNIKSKGSLLPSNADIKTFFDLYRKYGISNFMINFIDLKSKTEFGRLHLILESKAFKNKLKNLKEEEYNKWLKKDVFEYIDEVIEHRYNTLFIKELLRKTGFRLKYKGLNGYKYDYKTSKFEKNK